MPTALTRKAHSIDVNDADAVRLWLKGRIDVDTLLHGQPHPRVYLVGDGFEEVLDLHALSTSEPGVHVGATFQALHRPKIERRLMVVQLILPERRFAVLFEEMAEPGLPRRWWMSMREYQTDAETGLGRWLAGWADSHGETENPALLPAFLHDVVAPPPGTRAGRVLPPRDAQPDIQVAYLELPPESPLPTSAREMVAFAGQVIVPDLLKGEVKGIAVVRIVDRDVQIWVLGDELPADLDDMVRYIVAQAPAAEGVALAQVSIFPGDADPKPMVQIVAERAGEIVESRAPLGFPEGPGGPKILTNILWSPTRPVPEEGLWLGVDPMVMFELGPIGQAEG